MKDLDINPLFQNELALNRNTFVGLGLALMAPPLFTYASYWGVCNSILVPLRARGMVAQA